MTKVEKNIIELIRKNLILIFLLAITLCAILLRASNGIHFESGDYKSFLLPWWNRIEQGGVQGLANQVGNYNIPYQIIILLFTYTDLGPLYSYKLLSIFFDFILAFSAGLLVYSWSKGNRKIKGAITYAAVLLSLTVIFNSAYWAQCDSIYVSFILLSLYFLKKEKNIPAFIFLGLSLAFKLQVIFIIPFYLCYYFTTRKVSILHFLIIPAIDVIMCLPAIFMGRPIVDIVKIYAEQTDYGKLIQFNCPNIYALICDGNDGAYYELFKTFSILLTIAILGTALALLIYKNVDLHNTENLLLTSIWTSFTCLMFLSSMHERYSYLLDILLIVYCVITYKKFWVAVVCHLVSLRGYCFYLFKYDFLDIKITAIIYMVAYAYLTYAFVKEVLINGKKNSIENRLNPDTEEAKAMA